MAAHFYGVVARAQASERKNSNITVNTSSVNASQIIELMITDGAVTARDVYNFCEWLASLVVAMEGNEVIVAGTLLSGQT